MASLSRAERELASEKENWSRKGEIHLLCGWEAEVLHMKIRARFKNLVKPAEWDNSGFC